jgi:hypothetical protein
MSEYDELRDCRKGCKLCGAVPNPLMPWQHPRSQTITCKPGCPNIYSYGQSPEDKQRWLEEAREYRA